MKIGIIHFPRSNSNREVALGVQRAGMEPVDVVWGELGESLELLDGYIVHDDFTEQADSHSVILASYHPFMQKLAAQGGQGKPILGIGSGAHLLVESGLVPGLENNKVGMALLPEGAPFGCASMRLSSSFQRNAFTRLLTARDTLPLPTLPPANSFVMTPALLHELHMHGLDVFRYCNTQGAMLESMSGIAAVGNKNGNVMAILPPIEQMAQASLIFQSMRDYIATGKVEQGLPLAYYPRASLITHYQAPAGAQGYAIESLSPDEKALSLQAALQTLGIAVQVKRYTHWEVTGEPAAMQQAKDGGWLFDEKHEHLVLSCLRKNELGGTAVSENQLCHAEHDTLLVRLKDDQVGRQKLQALQASFGIKHFEAIKYGEIWHFNKLNNNDKDLIKKIISTRLVVNPFIHTCYYY